MKIPKLMLAPMAGVTDMTFRKLCVEQGAEGTVSEMISAKGLYYKDKKTAELAKSDESENCFFLQLFGSEPEIVAYSAKKVCEMNPNIKAVDINMGCPMPKITGNGEGSALMKAPELAGRIVKAVADCGINVTVKMRTGWDSASLNAPELAKICEQSGAKMICVHGRTKEQLYRPPVDTEAIKKVKKSVGIPVIANGGIYSGADALRLLEVTGCDGVAVGQGSMGNPWIFKEILYSMDGKSYTRPEREEVLTMAWRHVKMLCADKGEYIGVRESRKHLGWYIKGLAGASEARGKINTAQSMDEIKEILDRM